MKAAIYINGVEVDIIETLGEFLIVQEIESYEIYTVCYYELDTFWVQPTVSSAKIEECKIISLSGWKECQKLVKNGKQKKPKKKRLKCKILKFQKAN